MGGERARAVGEPEASPGRDDDHRCSVVVAVGDQGDPVERRAVVQAGGPGKVGVGHYYRVYPTFGQHGDADLNGVVEAGAIRANHGGTPAAGPCLHLIVVAGHGDWQGGCSVHHGLGHATGQVGPGLVVQGPDEALLSRAEALHGDQDGHRSGHRATLRPGRGARPDGVPPGSAGRARVAP